MEFVTGVDEALYETLLPVAHRKQVADINFVTYRPRAGGRSKEFAAFKRSFIYLPCPEPEALSRKNAEQEEEEEAVEGGEEE
ncbi:hypothetical protein AK812_SmicGene11862 [Symbiodinium microadriaticum]|uniref:Uncharacterized protein n=1 Tax=Symbiodinium microadriaticum TaxID=2951 RepID=A0A1Q9EC61_SYMMI|nr:hypothetical protein AK812_SmicGene11862 [Symbiodinium microadriaticum]